ncbi:DUF669 domain-containing protein, partial [Bacillus thuringiensis]|nr:DUF669 domain-containing protein [Bacillus thuringiensis]
MSFKFKFDEENVSQGFGLVEEGKYEVTMIAAEAKEWQGQYSIGFDVEIRSDIEQKHQGAKILYNTLYLTSSNPDYKEDTEKKRNSFLKACGYTGKQELDLNAVVHEILGKTVLAYVKHETKNDKTFAKVKFVAPSNVT